MKNKFLVSLLFGTALCAGFGDVAFGMEDAATIADRITNIPSYASKVKNGKEAYREDVIHALLAKNPASFARVELENLLRSNGSSAVVSSSVPVRSIPVASTTSDASAGGGSTDFTPPATNPKFKWSTYKNEQKPQWQAETLNAETLNERKFVTSFLKHASRAAILDVLNYIPAERKELLARWISQAALAAPDRSIPALLDDEASASFSDTHRKSFGGSSAGGGAPARGLPSRTTAKPSENEAAIAYVEQKFSSRAAEKVRQTLEQGDENAIRDILNKYGYTSKESRDSRSDESLSSYTSAPSSIFAPAAKTSVTTTEYDDALDYIGRTYSEAARNKAKAVIERGNSEEIEAILRKYNVPR